MALTDRGICPNCQLFARVDQGGNLVALVDAERQDLLPSDDPFRNTPLATLFEYMESGGGPVTTVARYNGKPAIHDAHKQLTLRFRWLSELLIEYGIDINSNEIDRPAMHPDWMGTDFADAIRLLTIHWFDGGQRYDVVCELTNSGGAIHAIPPNAKYHLTEH